MNLSLSCITVGLSCLGTQHFERKIEGAVWLIVRQMIEIEFCRPRAAALVAPAHALQRAPHRRSSVIGMASKKALVSSGRRKFGQEAMTARTFASSIESHDMAFHGKASRRPIVRRASSSLFLVQSIGNDPVRSDHSSLSPLPNNPNCAGSRAGSARPRWRKACEVSSRPRGVRCR